MTDSFGRSLRVSLLVHGALFLLIFIRILTAPDIPLEIRNAIRVDVVGLPDKLQELPDPAPSVAPTPSPTPGEKVEPVKLPTKEAPKVQESKPTVDLKATKKDLSKSQKKAMERLRAMEALSKIKGEVLEERQKAAKAALKGAELAKGNALTGLGKIEYKRYYGLIETHLHQNWKLPQWLLESNLKAQAIVKIDSVGNVTFKKIVKSSGNSIFDAEVLEAIEKSSPFPPPPEGLQSLVSLGGVVFNFPDK